MTKILLIEDSALSRNMFRHALGDEYEYVEAPDGIRGLEMYFLEKPDLVVLDLTMPGINGMEVLTQIKQLDPKARVVIGTADIQDASLQIAQNLGATGYIRKPFTSENVRMAVQNALRG